MIIPNTGESERDKRMVQIRKAIASSLSESGWTSAHGDWSNEHRLRVLLSRIKKDEIEIESRIDVSHFGNNIAINFGSGKLGSGQTRLPEPAVGFDMSVVMKRINEFLEIRCRKELIIISAQKRTDAINDAVTELNKLVEDALPPNLSKMIEISSSDWHNGVMVETMIEIDITVGDAPPDDVRYAEAAEMMRKIIVRVVAMADRENIPDRRTNDSD